MSGVILPVTWTYGTINIAFSLGSSTTRANLQKKQVCLWYTPDLEVLFPKDHWHFICISRTNPEVLWILKIIQWAYDKFQIPGWQEWVQKDRKQMFPFNNMPVCLKDVWKTLEFSSHFCIAFWIRIVCFCMAVTSFKTFFWWPETFIRLVARGMWINIVAILFLSLKIQFCSSTKTLKAMFLGERSFCILFFSTFLNLRTLDF